MVGYQISLVSPVKYEYTGKFQAPSEEWRHETMPLTNYELIVMTQGTLYLSYAGTDYTVTEGEYLLLSPRTPVSLRKGFKAAYCSFYWLHFVAPQEVKCIDLSEAGPGLIKDEMSVILPETGKLLYADKILVLMKQLQDFIRSGYEALMANYMTSTILCELYHQTLKEKLDYMKIDYSKKQLYYDMVDYVNRNLYRNLKVYDIATHFGYNGKYLSHVFNNITGMTLKQFVLQKKIAEANYLLTDTNKTIGEIAGCLGFPDEHNFMKAYKKQTGLTPTEYRNAYAKRMLFHA